MNVVKLIIFTLIIPGFVVVYVPYSLYSDQEVFEIGVLKYIGLALMALGLLLYTISVINFLIQGKGTPAIWFTKQLRFLIGEEPKELVSAGLYKISRNPMYLGVVSTVFGLALFFESKTILIYAILLGLFFHLVIVLLEEPHLKKKYGSTYESYFKRTNRWIGLKSLKRKSK